MRENKNKFIMLLALLLSTQLLAEATDDLVLGNIAIGKTTFQDIQKVLGQSKFLPKKEHGDKRVCYYSESHPAVFLTISSGPMGGWSTITKFHVSQFESKLVNQRSCLKVKDLKSYSSTKSGLAIDGNTDDLKRKYGKRLLCTSSRCEYLITKKIPFTEKQARAQGIKFGSKFAFYDQSTSIKFSFRNNKVSEFSVYQVESY